MGLAGLTAHAINVTIADPKEMSMQSITNGRSPSLGL